MRAALRRVDANWLRKPFCKCFWSICSVPGTVLGTQDTSENDTKPSYS